MATSFSSPDLIQTIRDAQDAASRSLTRRVAVDGVLKDIFRPFPSPADWRDCWIYFLMVDRFANAVKPPNGVWNQVFERRQGGTFEGVRSQLAYLSKLGVKAIWLSPVLKNAKPDFKFNYHGYGAQDFLNIDERFASDGTRVTAEKELAGLVDEAHARGIFVILDIVLNHSARVFDYERNGAVVDEFKDRDVMNADLGTEPAIQWLNGFGFPRADWREDLPAPSGLSRDDAVWPTDLQNRLFFRRRGTKLTDDPGDSFVRGDFGNMRQLVVEYDATPSSQTALREKYGVSPVLAILIRAHQYLIAKYDIDGFRIDTVKYVEPEMVRNFGNAMREFGLTVGKKNFFTFGEIADDEETIAGFVGRRTKGGEGFGIDAALDFPLFNKLPNVVKTFAPVEEIRRVFEDRKRAEEGRLSSHGEAGRYFVTFADNHDQHHRLKHPDMPDAQVSMVLALLFTLQGIPCVYYGTEQGLAGTVKPDGKPDLNSNESTREALWGKTPTAFDEAHAMFDEIQTLAGLREQEKALTFGRLYFRQVSGNGVDFGHSTGKGGLVAFSRILVDREVLVIANTNSTDPFNGFAIVDRDINPAGKSWRLAYSNLKTTGTANVQRKTGASVVPVVLKKSEIQILVQA